MSQSLTISAPLAMAAVPGLIALGGVVVGIALNGWLTTGIEVARLNAANDDKTARWLWLRGYRKTPHAGPELTSEVAADDAVTGELIAVDGVDTEADAQHDDTDRPRWWATVVAFVVLAPLAFARRQWPVLVEWLSYRFKSQSVRDAEFTETYHRALEAARDKAAADLFAIDPDQPNDYDPVTGGRVQVVNPPTNPTYKSHRCPTGAISSGGRGYQSRHTHPDFKTGAYEVINPSIPAQRTDGDL